MTAHKNHLWTFSKIISNQAALPEIVVLLIWVRAQALDSLQSPQVILLCHPADNHCARNKS